MRRLHNALTFLSLALFVLAGIFWVRGYWACDAFGWESDHWTPTSYTACRYGISSGQGQFWLKISQWHMQMESYLPEKWAVLSPEGQKNLAEFREQRPERGEMRFRTWPESQRTAGELARQTLAGFEFIQPPPANWGRWQLPRWCAGLPGSPFTPAPRRRCRSNSSTAARALGCSWFWPLPRFFRYAGSSVAFANPGRPQRALRFPFQPEEFRRPLNV